MRIIRNNFYTVVKLWINQFGVMFLGFLVLLPSAGSKVPDWVMPAVSLFTVLFYLVLIFWVTLEVGLQDNVRLECGRIRKQWYKGTVLALAANLPSLLASVIACISKALIPGVDYFASAKGATGTAANFYSISTMVNEVLHVMYKGFFRFFGLDTVPFIYVFTVLLSLICCTLGYNAGTKGMFASLFAKKKEN